MRILQIIHDFLPKHFAGAEIYTYNLARALADRHEVSLFFAEYRPNRPLYTLATGAYRGLPYFEANNDHFYESFAETYRDPRMEDLFEEVLDRVNPDIIHIQHLINHSLNYPRMARARGIPVVFTAHDYWLTCPRWGQRMQVDGKLCHTVVPATCATCVRGEKDRYLRGRGWRKRLPLLSKFGALGMKSQIRRRTSLAQSLSADVSCFVAPSKFLLQKLVEFGVPESKIIHADYGFDFEQFAGFRRTPSKVVRFGFIGTLNFHKGAHVLVEAFNQLEDTSAVLKIFGDLTWFPEYARELQHRANDPNIRFMGAFDPEHVDQALAEIDVLVVPSIWFENSPLTIHEAMITRTPVITSNLGGMAELVTNGANGFLFEAGNAADLKNQLVRVIDQPSLFSNADTDTHPVKPIEENAREMESIYQRLLSARHGNRL